MSNITTVLILNRFVVSYIELLEYHNDNESYKKKVRKVVSLRRSLIQSSQYLFDSKRHSVNLYINIPIEPKSSPKSIGIPLITIAIPPLMASIIKITNINDNRVHLFTLKSKKVFHYPLIVFLKTSIILFLLMSEIQLNLDTQEIYNVTIDPDTRQ